ncbi:hypothetical protein FJ422_30420 [Mesorhizobium sp. B2-6-3]|uniref:hypothetical protein n=1 Tax=Mesorhizobium sp. B2-6-3 TaxID=2589914 RepID=UPI001126AD7D|nr:hypothetical protein [Mesorhizobium sp. B2-6-3]TPJ76200.1 hypothetical protein FJ422_30420 [Mesorhizobium sp. B2-6-3]
MKSNNGYMTRALRSSDPRYARVLDKLGYGTRHMVPEETPASLPAHDDITLLRAEYERMLGKKPFHGWDAEQLREKIAAARD